MRRTVGLAAAAVVGTTGLLTATQAHAAPSISDVQSRVDTLYRQAEIASENYNDAKLHLAALRHQVKSLAADQKRQSDRLDLVRSQLRDSLLKQYEGAGIARVGQVIAANSPKKFLAGMTTMSSVNDVESNLLRSYKSQVDELDVRRAATARQAAQVAKTEASLKSDKDDVESKLADAKELLGSLKADQRAQMQRREELQRQREIASRDAVRTPAAPTSSAPASAPASGRAQQAVAYAMAQIGDAYVWAATGPNAFDCSGLTMQAWAAAGVSLPHSSSEQYAEGRKVAESDLEPGDLVFYYSPISHVAIYVGHGEVVGAQNPSDGVAEVPVDSMPYSGAVRPG